MIAVSPIPLAVIILAAGRGTRMCATLPKVLHPLAGRPLITHLRATLNELGADPVIVVTAPPPADIQSAVKPAICVTQDPPLGTGHAVQTALPLLKDFQGDVLVLVGDAPLVRVEQLKALLTRRREGAAIAVLGFRSDDPGAYGRMITNTDGKLLRIVEAKDATPDELSVNLCNSGSMVIDGQHLVGLLAKLENHNIKGEYYLTDIIAIAHAAKLNVAYTEAPVSDVTGINSQAELAHAEAILQQRLRQAALDQGVRMQDPASVYLSFDTRFGQDVVIEPNVYFGPGVEIGDNVRIRAFSHLEGCCIAEGASVGPFARLRPGADIGLGARIGNFVEVKNAQVGNGAKINHLSYVGDADVGALANIGAGVITCNYDGFGKYRTAIGQGAFIGSNSALVAPVKIGDGAIVGAGSTITGDVPTDAVSLSRVPQSVREGIAPALRAKAKAHAQAAKSKK